MSVSINAKTDGSAEISVNGVVRLIIAVDGTIELSQTPSMADRNTKKIVAMENFPVDPAQQGSQLLPSGILLQWGSDSISSDGQRTVAFKEKFQGAPFSIQITPKSNVSGATTAQVSKTQDGFVLFQQNAMFGIEWFAIGIGG